MLFSKHFLKSFQQYIISFFELQFVITLCSLPILIVWGIPISIMSPLGNFIFTPLLILFLWISCITTLCIIAHIPTSFLEKILEFISNIWMYLLSFSQPSWIIGFPIKSITVSLLIIVFIVLWYKYIKADQKITVLFLTTCWTCMLLLQPFFTAKQQLKKIGDLPLWSLNIQNKTYLVDNGALCSKKNIINHLDYTILPNLIYHTGFTTIDTIAFYKPSTKLSKIINQYSKQFYCKNFLIPKKLGLYKKLKKEFENTDIQIKELHPKNYANQYQ